MWVTVAFFGVLALAAVAVFVVLPDWVRDRQATSQATLGVEPEPEIDTPPAPRPHATLEAPDSATVIVENEPRESELPPPVPAPPAAAKETPETPERQAGPPASRAARNAAAEGLARTGPRDPGFARAMSEGLAALDRGDYRAARGAFARAAAIRPDSPQSADGLARAETGARLATIRTLREQAAALETAEDWHTAAERYEAALELDPAVEFALDGAARGRRRAALDDRLEFHIANPARLSSGDVLEEAAEVLEQAREIASAGPRLKQQTRQLERLVTSFSTPVTATLESDELTEVVVYKVGRLGTFSRRVLSLRPGTYTVVGSRRGYRDVRRQLVVEPGVEPRPLAIRCEERI